MATTTRSKAPKGPTKAERRKAQVEAIRQALETDRYAVLKAIHVIHQRQTADEQQVGYTKHQNGMGWGGTDAEFMTSLHDQMTRKIEALERRVAPRTPRRSEVVEVALTPGQYRAARKNLRKYAAQLLTAAEEREADIEARRPARTDTLVSMFQQDLYDEARSQVPADLPERAPQSYDHLYAEPRTCGGCIECDGEDACTYRGSCGHWTQGPRDEPCMECTVEAETGVGIYEMQLLRRQYPGTPDEELEMMALEARGDRAQTIRDDEARWGREVG